MATESFDLKEILALLPEEQAPQVQCGINGCKTVYQSSLVMSRHKYKVHGVVTAEFEEDLRRKGEGRRFR